MGLVGTLKYRDDENQRIAVVDAFGLGVRLWPQIETIAEFVAIVKVSGRILKVVSYHPYPRNTLLARALGPRQFLEQKLSFLVTSVDRKITFHAKSSGSTTTFSSPTRKSRQSFFVDWL
ncbi:hypothetical protein QCA50_009142 [Cerrena zonata]|uniref:Uncharacterized protein n=1 Tax=Cerrena zonata TaxID=2478898 RepID=A0AAW0G2H7_9APHY